MGEVKMVKVVSAAAAGVVFIVAAAGSRVVDEDEQQPRFYDEAAFSEYESDGEEWGNYNAIPDLYKEEQRLVTVQRNSNRRKKTGQSNVQEMANNPFDDPFFNEFVRKHKKKQVQVTVQQPAKDQAARPPTPAITVAPVKKQAAKVTKPPQKFVKKVEQQGKPIKTKAEKQKQNELIRDFTLMISKLLFQLSQIKE